LNDAFILNTIKQTETTIWATNPTTTTCWPPFTKPFQKSQQLVWDFEMVQEFPGCPALG
jgi:hypothetical protein